MRLYKLGAHTKTDLKVHVIWIPKYRKRVPTGQVAIRARDVLRQIALEHEIEIIIGKVSSDHIHMFISYPATQNVSKIMQWLKGISSRMLLSEFPTCGNSSGVDIYGLAAILPSARATSQTK
jgi:REP-associated tyrosine transposase